MICFTWWGLTQYAARAIEAFNKVSTESVCVVATRPSAPVQGLEQVLSCPLMWVEEADTTICLRLPEVPRVLFVSNWKLPAWKAMERCVREKNGRVVAFIDTDFKFSWRLILRSIYYRLVLARRFDAVFAVGKSGYKLARFYGVAEDRIFLGLYGADDSLFFNGVPLAERPKRIIYVGQFISRKNVLRMCEAFKRASAHCPGWELSLYGRGPLLPQLQSLIPHPSSLITIHDFVQSDELAKLYRQSRVFILPSLEEHWGVVVHEAALSGCYLLLSDRIGAADDFADAENSALFDPLSEEEMAKAMERAMSLSTNQLERGQAASLKLAKEFGPHKFIESVKSICQCTSDLLERDAR